VHLQFNQPVRIKSISFRTDGEHASKAPNGIRLFINKESIGFEDVEDESQATQVLALAPKDVSSGNPVPLRYVKFQNVHILHVSKARHCSCLLFDLTIITGFRCIEPRRGGDNSN